MGPITPTAITVNPFETYQVTLNVAASSGGPTELTSATLDPEFFLQPGESGQLIYSAGVTQAVVPEPGSLSLLAAGLLGLLTLRRGSVKSGGRWVGTGRMAR
jgi:hypothetical protein